MIPKTTADRLGNSKLIFLIDEKIELKNCSQKQHQAVSSVVESGPRLNTLVFSLFSQQP